MQGRETLTLDLVALRDIAGGDGLRAVRLVGWGRVKTSQGDIVVDDEGVAAVVDAFTKRGVSVPIDVEHGSLPEYQTAAVGPQAYGWVERIFGTPGEGLYAMVRWSPRGRQLIKADAYRYISPVLAVNREDRRIVELHSAALVNRPAIAPQEKLAASENSPKEPAPGAERTDAGKDAAAPTLVHNSETVKFACTTPDTARDLEIGRAVKVQLGLPHDADERAVLLALADRRHVDVLAAREKEIVTLKDRVEQLEFDAAIEPFVLVNCVNKRDERDVAMLRRMFRTNREDFEAVLSARRPVVPAGQTDAPPRLSSRGALLLEARTKYTNDRSVRGVTSLRAFTNQLLRERGEGELSKDEAAGAEAAERDIVAASNRAPVEAFVGR